MLVLDYIWQSSLGLSILSYKCCGISVYPEWYTIFVVRMKILDIIIISMTRRLMLYFCSFRNNKKTPILVACKNNEGVFITLIRQNFRHLNGFLFKHNDDFTLEPGRNWKFCSRIEIKLPFTYSAINRI